MPRPLALLAVCTTLALAGCNTTQPGPSKPPATASSNGASQAAAVSAQGPAEAAAPEVPWSQVKQEPGYPFSEIEKVYEAVLDGITKGYFKDFPDLDKAHTKAMRDFIAKEYPRSKFVELMVQPEARDKLQRAQKDAAYRDTKEFKDCFTVTISVSVSMAKMIIGGQIDIYVAKFVDKNETRLWLLTIATNEDEQQFASWVSTEVPAADAIAQLGKDFKPTSGDRYFAFCSPAQTWEDLCGRQGFLIVRDNKIVHCEITMMN